MVQQKGTTARRAIARLRRDIAALEGRCEGFAATDENRLGGPPLHGSPLHGSRLHGPRMRGLAATGHQGLDQLLGGGIPSTGLLDLQAEAARDAGLLSGFAAALSCRLDAVADGSRRAALWIAAPSTLHEAGFPHGAGLQGLGFDTSQLMLVAPRRLEDALWVAEEAARTAGLGTIFLDMRGASARLGLRETQRLHFRARETGTALFMLRHGTQEEASAAPLRLCVAPAPAGEALVLAGTAAMRPVAGGIGPPGYGVRVAKNRAGPAGSFHLMIWNSHERHFEDPAQRPRRRIATGAGRDAVFAATGR